MGRGEKWLTVGISAGLAVVFFGIVWYCVVNRCSGIFISYGVDIFNGDGNESS